MPIQPSTTIQDGLLLLPHCLAELVKPADQRQVRTIQHMNVEIEIQWLWIRTKSRFIIKSTKTILLPADNCRPSITWSKISEQEAIPRCITYRQMKSSVRLTVMSHPRLFKTTTRNICSRHSVRWRQSPIGIKISKVADSGPLNRANGAKHCF